MEMVELRQQLTLTVLRKQHGISQEELATAIDSNQTSISQYETGVHKIPRLRGRAIIKFLKSRNRKLKIKLEDLHRPWDEVLLERRR